MTPEGAGAATGGDGHRERIVAAAAELLSVAGRDAVSTRAVGAAAGVQAPTIYRLFGDKQGLLRAVAVDGFRRYLASKQARTPSEDPVEDLRAGWDQHVELGLSNPALYQLLYDDPDVGSSPAALAAVDVLAGLVHRIAEAGRLRVPERRAVQLLHAAGRGITLTLIATAEAERDAGLSTAAREAIIAAITTDSSTSVNSGDATGLVGASGLGAAAVTLRALLPHAERLTGTERAMLAEWLDRLVG